MRAQYGPGVGAARRCRGYLDEEGVPDDSSTETYAALRLEVHNWRWAGVPIFLRTGKRLARKVTEIAVQLKPVPHLAFQSQGSVGVQPNQLILTVQPNEGVSLSLGAKIPGSSMRIRPVNMEFLYGIAFMSQSPEAYERLILDAMRGDATLFTRNDEVDAQWSIIDPILQGLGRRRRLPLHEYAAGLARARRRPTSCSRRAAGGRSRCDATTSGASEDTTPGADRGGAAALFAERHEEERAYVPARVLNLVVIVDRDFRGEIENRLERVGRYHPSRLVAVRGRAGPQDDRRVGHDRHRRRAAAGRDLGRARAGRDDDRPAPPPQARHDRRPARGHDLATMVWSPHGHPEAVDALRRSPRSC